MAQEAESHRIAADRELRRAQSRCLDLLRRLQVSGLPPPSYGSLVRLINAELRSLSHRSVSSAAAPAAAASSYPLSSNVGYLEAITAVLLHPSIQSISRVAKPIPSSDPPLHVDVVCTFRRSPAWFFVSDRNPSYISWISLRSRVERALVAARRAGSLKPASILFLFSRGVAGHIEVNLVDEFGSREVDFSVENAEGNLFEEVEDGWLAVGRIGTGEWKVFEIMTERYFSRNEIRVSQLADEVEEIGGSDDKFASLLSKMRVNSSELVNFDTTALVAMVSGISNGCCEQLLEASEEEMRARFKGNYEFVIRQVISELQRPMLTELDHLLSGKKGIVCVSILSEFKELISMCGGPNENLRAQQLIKHLMVVPDCPSARVIGLPTTRKIQQKNKIAFGTGDHWNAPTLTANMGFVRAVSQAAMSLWTIEHLPRALTGD